MQDVNKAAQHFPSLIKLKWLPFCIWLMGEKCIRPWKVLANRNGVSFFSLDHMTHLVNWSSPKQCWAAHGGFVSTFLGKSQASMLQPWCSPNYCLSRPGQVRVGTALTSSPPPQRQSIQVLQWAWLGLARDLPGAEGCFLSPTGNNFPGHGSPGLPIPWFHESSRVCDSGTIVGHAGVSIPDPVFICCRDFSLRGII